MTLRESLKFSKTCKRTLKIKLKHTQETKNGPKTLEQKINMKEI